ncbi:Chondroadherin-like protein [Eumeta japonica]|uniref:Chondroadherin-like protein n=1 Tax=Eumeta variegata TaxID=151549 RepID=A0A4C1WCV2_EUMVA|nr:Chondroadherin-like protein [Eumeta japonica]
MTTILHPHACSYKLVPITLRIWLIIFSATISWPTVKSEENWNCQNGQGNDKCLCYTLDDGVFVECPGATAYEISNALKKFTTSIHSLSIYDLNEDIELLGPNIIPQGTCAKHVHISQTNVRDLDDDIFVPLRKCLETLSIESSRIKYIPQKAFTGLSKLISLDLKANAIEDVPSYSFYGLPLMRLNLRTNNIRDVSEAAFSSLEKFLSEIDFGENALEVFPMSSVQKLRHLRSLRLAFNDISEIPDVENSGLVSLEFLDLSYNNFEYIAEEYLKFCPSLKTLSLQLRSLKLLDLSYNKLQNILNEDMANLAELTILNLSHNNIKYLSATTFKHVNKIKEINLSHNKLDKISLELLNTIEAQVEQIHFEGNMIVCSCEKNNTWTWIQDHPRTIRASIITCLNREFVKEKCILPTISQLSIDKNKDNSVKTKYLKTNEASAQITELKSNLNYVLCVIALYNEPLNYEEFNYDSHNETINDNVNYYLNISHEDLAELLQEAPSNECVLFNKKKFVDRKQVRDKYNIATILTRRLGLMVGCGLGCVVFFVMVSVLLYTKIQERRRITKSDPGWSEMTNYHSVLHSKEDMLENHDAASTDNILLGMGKCLK